MFWDFGSIQTVVTGGRTISAQNTAGDHVKKSSPRNQQPRRKQQQQLQAVIEQVTIEMGVMRNELAAHEAVEAKTSKCLEKFSKTLSRRIAARCFYGQFGKFLRHAIHEDSTNQIEITELVRFSNSKSGDELIRLKEHVDCMKATAE